MGRRPQLRNPDRATWHPPAIANGLVSSPDDRCQLRAVDLATGQLVAIIQDAGDASPVVADGHVLLGAPDGLHTFFPNPGR